MTGRILIVGGSGQIGRACAVAFARTGWSVVCAQRNPASFPGELNSLGVRPVTLDRADSNALGGLVEEGFDAVVDTVAFDVGHALQWNALQDRIGALAVISTGSVYTDAAGKTLDEARSTGFPNYPASIAEDQVRTPAGEATYSARKIAMEDALLDSPRIPLVILRPFAVHGPGSRSPREWWFIARALRGDTELAVAYEGRVVFTHQPPPTSPNFVGWRWIAAAFAC